MHISIYIKNEELRKKLKDLAEKERRSVSFIARDIIERYLKEQKKGK